MSDNPNRIIADVDGTQATVKDFGDGDARIGVHMITSFEAHASNHEDSGSDEISVAGLSGLLADNQNPTAHASDHEPAGGDAMAVDAVAGTGSLRTLGTGAQTACAGNDSRLSDARTPTSHASSHQSGGGDALQLDNLAAPDDNTDLDATTSAHGLLMKLGGGTTDFLRADGSWAAPSGGIFGSEYYEAADDDEDSTTATSMQSKLAVTTPSLPLGDYRFAWMAEISNSSDRVTVVRFKIEDELYGRISDDCWDDYAWHYAGGIVQLDAISGTQDIDIDYRTHLSGTAWIRRARVHMWRVA